MFLLGKPSQSMVQRFLLLQRNKNFSYAEIGSTNGTLPPNYTVDRNNRVKLGSGAHVFQSAMACLRQWDMFKLGWTEVLPRAAPIKPGQTVAVLVRHFGFWSLNACRIVYVYEDQRGYGFAYGTLHDHAEQGEERFSIDWSVEDDSVVYSILAFSKPRKWQARAMYPLGRLLQKKFARDSLAAMHRAMNGLK
jgi:uncharacterized protein (UPF0548 family)